MVISKEIIQGFRGSEYSFGYEVFVGNFLGSSQNWAKFRDHSYAF